MTSEPYAQVIDGKAERAFNKVKRDVVTLKSDVEKLKKIFSLKGDIDYVNTLERIRLELQNLDTKIEMNKIEVVKFMKEYSFSEGEVKYLRSEVIPLAKQAKENKIEIDKIKEMLKKHNELAGLEADNKVATLRIEMNEMRKELLEEISFLKSELKESRKRERIVQEKVVVTKKINKVEEAEEEDFQEIMEEEKEKRGFGRWLFFREDEADSIERVKNEVR